jgi:carboxymethylenebutenolidase
MGKFVKLTASDGHVFDAYVAKPAGEPTAALVVVQEIFGVNGHIRSVADGYAKDGFLVVAPALFDRYERGVDIGYEGADMEKAMSFVPKLDMDVLLKDTATAIAYAREQSGKKTGVVGYCLGGSIAWLSSTRLGVDAAVGYYGGLISKFAVEQPKSPIILHFGQKDAHIPEADRKTITSAHPKVPVYLYDAGHGFNCDARKDYDASSAKVARERSLDFLKINLG